METQWPQHLTDTEDLHILLVEDREGTREVFQKLFRLAGFTPITADSVESALAQLHATPQLALLVTDMDLGEGAEFGGHELLARVRSINKEIPVVAYSANYDKIDPVVLNADKTAVFNRTFPKVSKEAEFNQIVVECRTLAINYLVGRRVSVNDAKMRFEREYPGTEIQFEVLRRFSPRVATGSSSTDEQTIDEVLSHEGYRFIILSAGTRTPDGVDIISRTTTVPIPIWVREMEPGVIVAELYGYSSLYSDGPSEEEATKSLLALMLGFHIDYQAEGAVDNYAEAAALRDYLASVFKEKP